MLPLYTINIFWVYTFEIGFGIFETPKFGGQYLALIFYLFIFFDVNHF